MSGSESYKLLFIGEPGAGKTTCIESLSDIAPLVTDVRCTDELARLKENTTVAFDYGELSLGDQGRLLLYGLPGQSRFRFMFDVVRENLLGVIVLVDAASSLALDGLRETLDAYESAIRELPCVVALNKNGKPPSALLEGCEALLRERGMVAPILVADARRREELVRMFDLLFMMIENGVDPKTPTGEATWH
jgi:signal recognition particle receptor subunit beta